MKTEGIEPAFPTAHFQNLNGDMQWGANGMTKREYFAGLAMQAYISRDDAIELGMRDMAHDAVSMADALIAELAKEDAR